MRGVFDDGSAITLGGQCFVACSSQSSRSRHLPQNTTHEVVFDVGGGALSLVVRGEILRANQGDAEWWAAQKLLALAASGVGDLSVGGYKYPGAYFQNGQAEVHGWSAVSYWYQFVASLPARDATLAAGDSAGADEATYAGRGTTDIYHLAGEQLGATGGLSIAVSRQVNTVGIPRCYGVRVKDIVFGRTCELTYTGHRAEASYAALSEWCWRMQTRIGYQRTTLTGCGNTWSDVLLMDVAPQLERDARGFQFQARMVYVPA